MEQSGATDWISSMSTLILSLSKQDEATARPVIESILGCITSNTLLTIHQKDDGTTQIVPNTTQRQEEKEGGKESENEKEKEKEKRDENEQDKNKFVPPNDIKVSETPGDTIDFCRFLNWLSSVPPQLPTLLDGKECTLMRARFVSAGNTGYQPFVEKESLVVKKGWVPPDDYEPRHDILGLKVGTATAGELLALIEPLKPAFISPEKTVVARNHHHLRAATLKLSVDLDWSTTNDLWQSHLNHQKTNPFPDDLCDYLAEHNPTLLETLCNQVSSKSLWDNMDLSPLATFLYRSHPSIYKNLYIIRNDSLGCSTQDSDVVPGDNNSSKAACRPLMIVSGSVIAKKIENYQSSGYGKRALCIERILNYDQDGKFQSVKQQPAIVAGDVDTNGRVFSIIISLFRYSVTLNVARMAFGNADAIFKTICT